MTTLKDTTSWWSICLLGAWFHIMFLQSLTLLPGITLNFYHPFSFEKNDILRIVRALAIFRPSLIALQMPLSLDDEIFVEKCFQRSLLVRCFCDCWCDLKLTLRWLQGNGKVNVLQWHPHGDMAENWGNLSCCAGILYAYRVAYGRFSREEEVHLWGM